MARHKAYKWFIDNLVDVAHHDSEAPRLRSDAYANGALEKERDPDERELRMRQLLMKLDRSDRLLIADLLSEARCRAVHDVAGFLDWAIAEAQLSIVLHSETIPNSPYASMHRDFVCRYDGEKWPDSGQDVMQ